MGDGCPFPAGRGRGFPPGPHAGRGCPLPFLPSRGAQVVLLRPKGGEGGLAAKSLALCATQSCPAASGRRCLGSAAGGAPSLSPVSRVPEAPPPPVLWPCPCPGGGVGGAELRSPFRSSSGVCMGESSFHDAPGRRGVGRGKTVGKPSPPTLGRPPCPRRHSVITGKENCFKKLPC